MIWILTLHLIAERFTKKAFRAFFDWVGGWFSRRRAMPCDKNLERSGGFLSGSRGATPCKRSVVGYPQTLLAEILLTLEEGGISGVSGKPMMMICSLLQGIIPSFKWHIVDRGNFAEEKCGIWVSQLPLPTLRNHGS